MSLVIAGIYEIQEKIGAGGGGIVYLGQHLRLKKQVVLKADKRTLSTGMEMLRREVDMLKDLSHTHIPQVYDFVQEDGLVYTVMDFVEGESFDKLLGRGQKFTQPQVIKWACQLLDALSYLHNRPPHGILHGDIKPANIMLRPNGDICLIDYNIALALGEDGAVKVGFSRGYASPEHYGADYIRNNEMAAVRKASNIKIHEQITDSEKTLILSDKNKNLQDADSKKTSTAGRQRGIMLDVRSDIYSLGATLYHILSGCCPAESALEVEPLEADVCSPGVAAIIQKAMNPDPDMRYQSSEEMQNAFLQLFKRDRRVIRYKISMTLSAVTLIILFLIGGSSSFIGLKQLEQMQRSLALAEYSANALAEGNKSDAVRQALDAIPSGKNILEAPVTAQAQKALSDALGVYDLSDGFKDFGIIELPSVPFSLAVSPEGSRFAAVYAYEVTVFDMETQQKIISLPIQNSALANVVFLDETCIVYAGNEGVTVYNIDEKEVLWTGATATFLSVSADHKTLACVDRDRDYATIYRIFDGQEISKCSFRGLHMSVAVNDIFANPEDNIFALNEDGSLLAVSFSNGGLEIFNLENEEANRIIYEESDYRHFEGGFNGTYFAYTAEKSGETLFRLMDMDTFTYVGGYDSKNHLLLQADDAGIYLVSGNLLVSLEPGLANPDILEEKELAYTNSADITAFSIGKEYVLVSTDDSHFSFYDNGAHLLSEETVSDNCDFVSLAGKFAVIGNRNETFLQLLKYEENSGTRLMSYDPRYKHDEARISKDGKTAMLFSFRNFRLYDMHGNLLAQVELPDAENIYDQQFVKNDMESWLEVIWYDGTKRCYSAADGLLISEEVGERPSKDLYEEFWVGRYKISSSLHAAPEVYDIESNKFVARLKEDSYLTYVTLVGEYIITEYISAAGERYGILLDPDFRELAYLPSLCDIVDDVLIFDYGSGYLRQCHLYSLEELVALGKAYLQ